MSSYSNSSYSSPQDDNADFGTTADGEGFKHGLDEDNAMTGEVKEEEFQATLFLLGSGA